MSRVYIIYTTNLEKQTKSFVNEDVIKRQNAEWNIRSQNDIAQDITEKYKSLAIKKYFGSSMV